MLNHAILALTATAALTAATTAVSAQNPSSNQQTATVTTVAPIYLTPDNSRTPLRTTAAGTKVRVLEVTSDWVKVEFSDPQYGRRTGYVEAKNVRTGVPEQPPMAASIREVPPDAGTSAPLTGAALTAPLGEGPETTRVRDRNKVTVFLKAAGSDAGFTDPSKDRQDSLRDLQKRLRDSKSMTLVDSAAAAVIVLEVLDRETRREANGWTAFSGAKQNKSYLTVRLTAGEYSTDFEGESGSKGVLKGYGAAAGKVVDQLENWVAANRSKLLPMAR